MKELSITESLDSVLKEIAENSPPGLQDWEIVKNMTRKAQNMLYAGQWANIELIIEKLISDKFIERRTMDSVIEKNKTIDIYFIRFEGRLFIEQNGYSGQKVEKEKIGLMQIQQHRINVRVYWLTLWIALSTAVQAALCSIEIWKHFQN